MRIITGSVCFFVLALVAISAGAGGVAGNAADPSSGAAPLPFSHTDHVSRDWIWGTKEQPRDCRGCHDYTSAPEERLKPADSCMRCHEMQDIRVGGTPRVDPAADSESVFDHGVHGSLDCGSCHKPEKKGEVPAVMWVPKLDRDNIQLCASCHAPGAEAEHTRESMNKRITRYISDTTIRERGGFSHALHLRQEDFKNLGAQACEKCHTSLHEANARNLGEKQFSIDACKSCHAHENDEIEAVPVERPSKSAATFVHYYHLGEDAADINPDIRDKRCQACHEFDEGADEIRLNSRFGDDAYDGCATCHTSAGWQVDNHGADNDCVKCHEVSEGLVGGRPMVEVPRPIARAFRIESQRHQHITGDVSDDCQRCHLSGIDPLPSRVDGRKFDHLTHLSDDPKRWEGECRKCHVGMVNAVRPEDVNAKEVFEWSHCEDCHATEEITPVWDETPRRVPNFAHDKHLRSSLEAGGRKLVCLDCHVSHPEDISNGIGIKPDALTCTQCHGHADNESHMPFARTTPHAKTSVNACGHCHLVGVPRKSEDVLVERLHLVSVKGERVHQGSQSCFPCHNDSPTQKVQPERDLTATMNLENPHYEREEYEHLGVYFDKNRFIGTNGERGTWCIDCHWGSVNTANTQKATLRKQDWYKDHRTDWREAYGSWLDRFPGIDMEKHK